VIVRRVEEELWLFDQADHAALCGAMAAGWGGAGFAPVPAWVQEAARVHDQGWPEWDALPRLHPERGEPHPYSDMPPQDYLEIWERGLARGWARGDGVGLLVSLHAMRFFAHRTRPADRALLERERERQGRALRALGAAGDPGSLPEPYATWYAWFFFWDGLSLFLCEGWESPWTRRLPRDSEAAEVTVRRVADGGPGGDVVVEPFPFRAPMELRTGARVLPARRWATQPALDAAVSAAEQRHAHWTIRES
jgi:hypothetical protein